MPRVCEPSAIYALQSVGAFYDDLSYLVRTLPGRFELRLLGSFCLCLFVEEDPVSEVDLPCLEFAIMIVLGFPFVVLCFELGNESLFFEVVEVDLAVLSVLHLIIGCHS